MATTTELQPKGNKTKAQNLNYQGKRAEGLPTANQEAHCRTSAREHDITPHGKGDLNYEGKLH